MSFMFLFLSHFCSLSFRVGTISTIKALYTLTFTNRVEGRYVTVRIPGEGKVLALCEVEVYGYHAPTGEGLGSYINNV